MNTHELHRSTFPVLDDPFSGRSCDGLGLTIEVRDDRFQLSRRVGGQWSVTIAAAALGLLFLVGPLVLSDQAAPVAIAARAAQAASTLFGICLLLVAAYQSLAWVSLRVVRGEIERIRSWGGVALHRCSINPADVEDLLIYTGTPSLRISYDLVCRGAFGSVELLRGIRDRELLERLRRQIMLTAGIRPSGTH